MAEQSDVIMGTPSDVAVFSDCEKPDFARSNSLSKTLKPSTKVDRIERTLFGLVRESNERTVAKSMIGSLQENAMSPRAALLNPAGEALAAPERAPLSSEWTNAAHGLHPITDT